MEQTDVKKDQIKESAKSLFFRFGFSKTSMEDIARQSGIAKPTLYYYYSGKEQIFNEIVINEAKVFMDKVETNLNPELSAQQKIAQFYRILYQDLKKYAREMEAVPEIVCQNSPHGKPIIDAIREMVVDKMRPILEAAKKNRNLKIENQEITLNALAYMTSFISLDWMLQEEESYRDQVIEQVIDIILHGIKRS